jgi:ABC-type Fe3+-hydroxamate transport system substrate-binding protein
MPTIIDALNRALEVPRTPQRIISLVPSLTEWLFALGLGDRVVGVTDFCTQPAAAVAEKSRLRGTKNPDRARILALEPDLIIANKEENRERDVLALAEAGLAVYVTDPCTVAGAIETLATLAEILDAVEAARPQLAEMRALYAEATAAAQVGPGVLVPIWRDPWMAIGADTYAADLLRVCGGQNVALSLDGRYPRFELEQIAALKPELIVLPSEPYAFSTADLPALAPVFSGAVHFVDGELLTWYGPRIPQALRFFRGLFGQPAVAAIDSNDL